MTLSIPELHQFYDGPIPDRLRDEAMGKASTPREQAIRDLTLLLESSCAAIERLQEQCRWYRQEINRLSGRTCSG